MILLKFKDLKMGSEERRTPTPVTSANAEKRGGFISFGKGRIAQGGGKAAKTYDLTERPKIADRGV